MTTTKTSTGRKRAVVALGALLGIGALVTAAAFVDNAYLNLGGATGFGGSDTAFNLQVKKTNADDVTEDGNWVECDTDSPSPTGCSVDIPGANAMIPGGPALTVYIPMKNTSTTIDQTLSLKFIDATDTADSTTSTHATSGGSAITVGEANGNYRDALEFTVSVKNGGTSSNIVTSAKYSELGGSGVTTAALGNMPASATRVLQLDITLKDQNPASYNGGTALLRAHINATS